MQAFVATLMIASQFVGAFAFGGTVPLAGVCLVQAITFQPNSSVVSYSYVCLTAGGDVQFYTIDGSKLLAQKNRHVG